MDLKILLASYALVFVAELGDKTQLTALAFSASSRSPWSVFLGTSLALVSTSALAVAFGAVLSRYLPERALHIASAVMFVLVGLVLLVNVARKVPDGEPAPAAPAQTEPQAATPRRGLLFGLVVSQALRFEEDIAVFFRGLAEGLTPDSRARTVLELLAAEEKTHAHSLQALTALAAGRHEESLLAAVPEQSPVRRANLAVPGVPEPTAGRRGAGDGAAELSPADTEALLQAMKAEEDAAEYYLALSRLTPVPSAQDAFRWLAMEEIRHAQRLAAVVRGPATGDAGALPPA